MTPNQPTDPNLNSLEGFREPGLPIREYWAILRKRVWSILLVLGLVSGLALLYIVNQPNIYRATATVEIRTDQNRVLSDMEPVVDPAGGARYWSTREFYETQYRIISSRAVAQQVVTALQLSTNLQFLGLSQQADVEQLRSEMERIDPVDRLMSMAHVEPIPDSYLVEISVEHTDPALATLLANTIAQVYVERNREQQLRGTTDAFEWLDEERVNLRNRVEQAEAALLEFRQQHDMHDATLVARQQLLTGQLDDVTGRLSAVREQLSQTRSEQRQIRRALESGQVADIPLQAVIENPLIHTLKQQRQHISDELRRLEAQYGENQYRVQGLTQSLAQVEEAIDREVTTILSSYDTVLSGIESRERELVSQQEAIRQQMVELSLAEPSYNQLERDIQLDTQTLQVIEQRHKEADLYRRQQDVNNIEMLDAAITPTRPVRPNRQQVAFIAAILGLVLGVGLAFLLEILDNTVKTQEDVEQVCGLTFLGVIPSIKGRINHRRRSADGAGPPGQLRDLHIHHNPKSTVAETCRAIRTNLHFMLPDKPLRRILVTSAGPREGKTSTAINLGTVMAQANRRVLLVETDMRKPRLHRAFQLPNEVGLTNLILGEVEIEQVVHSTVIPHLDVLPCGAIPPNPTELMHTDRFRAVVEELSARYDQIIFDSPPIIAVADSMILGRMADGVLLVIKAGHTSSEIVKRAGQLLRGIKAPLLGAILNDLDLEDRAYRYHHYYSYYYHHGQYYEESRPAKSSEKTADQEPGRAELSP
ncbi:MAG: polysaccharide biosynthesis tyrosine autokinase [Bradymonadales bacterium]|nr:polysaccharide biosynthesis tyrosine autokinase [Bradymonadales bacterium]